MQIYITIFTPNKTHVLHLKSEDRRIIDVAVGILNGFGCVVKSTDEHIEITNLVKVTNKIKESSNSALRHYANTLIQINRIISTISKMPDGEHIAIFLTNEPPTEKEHAQIKHELNLINSGKEIKEDEDDIFRIYDTYNVTTVSGDRARTFGTTKHTTRSCRYCNKTEQNVTFKTKSHLIPEGLGNKRIISNDECDTCNDYFGKTIDTDIISYLSIFRPIFDIKCRNGTPVLKGRNFRISCDDDNVAIRVKEKAPTPDADLPQNIILDCGTKITLQNIYRSLCKYAIGTIDSDTLNRFQKTLKWIRFNEHITSLPKVAKTVDYAHFSKFPQLVVYKRKNNDETLPLVVGEFHFTCIAFVYIVPTFDNLESDFCSSESYTNFWNHFSHFSRHTNWSYEDLSLDKPMAFQLNLNFEQAKPPEVSL